MITREDFKKALEKDRRKPVSAEVLYRGNSEKITYKARDFEKINFPVARLVIQYEKGSGSKIKVDDGKYETRDRRRVQEGEK